MLDTNICVHVLKNYPPNLRARFTNMTGRLCISAITLGELSFGAEKSNRTADSLAELEELVSRIEVLSFSGDAAMRYGQLRAELERVGTPIGSLDLLIGAHALAENIPVVTNNRREFDRIPGLRVENWV